MPGGLQVFDETGRTTFDTNYRVSRMLGTVQPGVGANTYHDDRLLTGIPFGFYVFEGLPNVYGSLYAAHQATAPRIDFSGNVMTITREAPPPWLPPSICHVYYGVR